MKNILVLIMLIAVTFSTCSFAENLRNIDFIIENGSTNARQINVLHIDYTEKLSSRVHYVVGLSFGIGAAEFIQRSSVYRYRANYASIRLGFGFNF